MELGGFPQTFKELKTLKGVGDYTAAAIASIAFGEPVAVVRRQRLRVLSRYYGIETPIDSTEGEEGVSSARSISFTYKMNLLTTTKLLWTLVRLSVHQILLIAVLVHSAKHALLSVNNALMNYQ